MKEIGLTQGKIALIDDVDYTRISAYKWCVSNSGKHLYAIRRMGRKGRPIRMQNIILGCEGIVDHINGNGLDNQKANLRPVTKAQNNANKRKRGGTSSQYIGVCWRQSNQRWIAQLKSRYLGQFDKEVTAAAVYDLAATKYFGEYARRNFPLKSKENNGRVNL